MKVPGIHTTPLGNRPVESGVQLNGKAGQLVGLLVCLLAGRDMSLRVPVLSIFARTPLKLDFCGMCHASTETVGDGFQERLL